MIAQVVKHKVSMSIHLKPIVLLMAIFIFFWGCDYARMSEQESIRPYETSIPEMQEGTIPIKGGLQVLREMDTEDLTNPLPFNQTSFDLGKEAYGYFCVMCHGPKGDGNGTVGQSFYPLPANLMSSDVLDQADGELFYTISFGMGRMPPLAYTATEEDRWAIIHYIRSLARVSE